MRDKYYTPTIEEFHVEFEFEMNWDDGAGNKDWSEFIFNKAWKTGQGFVFTLETIKKSIEEGDIRVKFLDQEDIESLEWKHVGGKLASFGEQYFEYNQQAGINHFDFYQLVFMQGRVKITLRKEYGYDNTEHTVFDGILKNKSELIKVLKQIGIK